MIGEFTLRTCPAQMTEKLAIQLDSDRRKRYSYEAPMPPIFRWYRTRVLAVLVRTLYYYTARLLYC